MRRGLFWAALVLALLAGAAGMTLLRAERWWQHRADPVSIATASLQSVREENRLTVFAARFVAVVTSEQDRFLLSARKTLIMPGTVRYDLDLASLSARDLHWDGGTRTLTVDLPPVTISAPAVDLPAIREYSGGGLLMHLTDAEHDLDTANRAAGVKELTQQAAAPLPLQLARQAAVNAIEHSFELPLHAAGIDATVIARFR